MDDKKFQSLSKPQQDVVLKIAAEAERQGVNPKLAIAVAEAETGGKFIQFDKDGVLTSPAGAQGLMQLLPSTVELYNRKMNAGINPEDEDSNIKGGVFILKDLLTKYKSPRVAVAMYNASPKANAEFVKQYEINPDAAIMSLKPETRKYSLRISQNFNLDDDNETGLISPQAQAETPKEANPNNPFAVGVPLADKAREATEPEVTNKEPTTLLEKASALANEVDPTYGALAGALANYGGSKLVKPPLTPAEIASLAAEEKLRLDRLALRDAAPMGFEDIQKSYDESQSKLETIKNEQKLREMQLKSIPPASPPPAPTPQEQLEIESRKITGAGAPYNMVQAIANERVPYNVAIQAIDTTHNDGHGKGSYDIVDVFNRNRERAERVGGSDFVLTGEKGPGELYLQRDIADPKNAEIQQRVEANQNQQAIFEQQQEQERLRLQAELDRISKERASHGAQHNVLAGQVRDVKPLKKAVSTSEQAAELAKYKAKLKAQNQPLTPQDILNKGKSVGRTVAGGAAGYYGVMSIQEALERFKNGDTSEGVLQTLGALSAGASLAPPVTPKLSGLKKAGTIGAVGMGGREIYRRLTQEPPAQ
jgi:hypothetical protein